MNIDKISFKNSDENVSPKIKKSESEEENSIFNKKENDDKVFGYAKFAEYKNELNEQLASYQEAFKNISEENKKLDLLVKIKDLKTQLKDVNYVKDNKSGNEIEHDGLG